MNCKLLLLVFIFCFKVKTCIGESRIVGGTQTTIQQCPFQLSLMRNNKHVCGAIVISKLWALTAAQCVHGVSAKDITLRGGSNSHSTGGNLHKVSKIVVHPSYSSKTKDFDIALLEVGNNFDSKIIKPIPLVTEGAITKPGSQVTVFGWGLLTPGGTVYPDKIQEVTIPLVEQHICNLAHKNQITDRMICAGLTSGGKDICDGDFGGAMVYQGKLVGVASWTEVCGKPGSFGVYTSISVVRGWIQKTCGV